MKHTLKTLLLCLFFLGAVFLHPLNAAAPSDYARALSRGGELFGKGQWDASEVEYLKAVKSPDVEDRIKAYEELTALYRKVRVQKKARESEKRLKREKKFLEALIPRADSYYTSYEVQKGDTYGKIARRYKTSLRWLMKVNGKKMLKPGDRLLVPRKKYSIIVDKKKRKLYWKRDGETLKIYPVSIGSVESESPEGEFVIINKIKNPVWYHNKEAIPPESPRNLLGTRWFGLNQKGYGIHGTRDPKSIGEAASHGCIRMHNRDVEELFSWVPVGTEVAIRSI